MRQSIRRRGVGRVISRLTSLTVIVLTVASCTEVTVDTIGSTSEPAQTADTTTSPPTPSTTSTTRPVTTTTTDLGTLKNPLPVGDPLLSGFTYSTFLTDWEGFVAGFVETGKGRFNDEVGRCLVLLGTITPTAIEEGAVTNIFSTPDFSLIVNGKLVDGEVNECDTDEVEAAGYGWILDAEVTVGTTYPFYQEFFLPDPPGELEVLVVGSASGSDALYYQPTVLEAIPAP